jgi:hypothetical protein
VLFGKKAGRTQKYAEFSSKKVVLTIIAILSQSEALLTSG